MRSTIVHEAGHLVVGLLLGIREQGITFYQRNGEAAQAYFTLDSPEKNLRRALSGILAQLEIMPESIEAPVLEAFRISVILDEFHPGYALMPEEAREFASGARDDMWIARDQASKIVGGNTKKISDLLRSHEEFVRGLISRNRQLVIAVADDIELWLRDATPETNPMMLYSPSRAKAIVEAKG